MNLNQHHFWKKRFTTTNIEVVIDDPLKIKDTFITNFASSDRVLVFEAKANNFIEQNYEPPTSPSFVADGGGTGISVDPDARNEVPIGIYDKQRCIDLFNEYLGLHENFADYFSIPHIFTTIDRLKNLSKYWTNELDPNHPFYQWLACVLNAVAKKGNKPDLQKGLFESTEDYLRRILQIEPPKPLPPIWEIKPFPFPVIPGIEDAPVTPNDVPWILDRPDLLDDFYRRIREKIKQIKEAQGEQPQTSGTAGETKANDVPSLSQFPPECKDKLKDALDRLKKDLEWLIPLLDILRRMKEIYDELMGSSGCSGLLRLDQEFQNRQIGRFPNLKEFFKFIQEWIGRQIPEWLGGLPGPDITPNFKRLTLELHGQAIHNQFMELLAYGNKPNRYADALAKLKAWGELPEESRSFYPPLKDLYPVLDSDTSTDEDAVILFGTHLAYNFMYPYRSEFAETDAEIEDFVTHMALFYSLPGGGLVA